MILDFSLIAFQHHGEGFGWNINLAEAFHASLTTFLLLKLLRLTGAVTSVDFYGDILAEGADSFTRNNARTNSSL